MDKPAEKPPSKSDARNEFTHTGEILKHNKSAGWFRFRDEGLYWQSIGGQLYSKSTGEGLRNPCVRLNLHTMRRIDEVAAGSAEGEVQHG